MNFKIFGMKRSSMILLIAGLGILSFGLMTGCQKNDEGTSPSPPAATKTNTPDWTHTVTPSVTPSGTFTITASGTFTATFTATPTATKTPMWVIVASSGYGPGPHTDLDLSVDSNGVAYVSCSDGGDVSAPGSPTVYYDYGLNWTNYLGVGLSTSTAHYTNVHIDPYNSTNISLTFYNDDILKPVCLQSIGGGSWGYRGHPENLITTAGYEPAMSGSDTGDFLYMIFRDAGNSSRATVLRCVSSSWSVLGAAGFSASAISGRGSIYRDNTYGYTYVFFRETGNSYKGTVMRHDNTNGWQYVGPSTGISSNAVHGPSIFVSGGTPYIAFSDQANSYYLSVMYYNGASWVYVGGTAGVSDTAVFEPEIFVDGSVVYVAYEASSDNGPVTVMKYDGSWSEMPPVAGYGPDADYVNIVVRNGIPFVAFQNTAAQAIWAYTFQ